MRYIILSSLMFMMGCAGANNPRFTMEQCYNTEALMCDKISSDCFTYRRRVCVGNDYQMPKGYY